MDRRIRLLACIGGLSLAGTVLATPFDQCGTFVTGLEGCVLFHPDDGSQDVNAGPPAPFHVGDRARVRGDLDTDCISFCFVPCVMNPVITACTPPCRADFDASGGLAPADIFAFLDAWFGGVSTADFDGSGVLAPADIFAFLDAWFTGCP